MADEVDRFQAVADDREEFMVIVYRQTIKDRDLDGTEWTKLGLPDLALVDGSAVNQIDTETFQVVETDKIIRKVEQQEFRVVPIPHVLVRTNDDTVGTLLTHRPF